MQFDCTLIEPEQDMLFTVSSYSVYRKLMYKFKYKPFKRVFLTQKVHYTPECGTYTLTNK